MFRTRIALVASVLLAGACEVPRFQGPQVQNPPPAFHMNREATQERRMFNTMAVVFHEAWVEASWGNFSGIYINGHPRVLAQSDVDAARRQAMADTEGGRIEFGPLESLEIDGRTAWGWGETWRYEDGGLQYVVFRAAVPYDTITYAVDFLTGEPGLKNRPDSLRTVVASFAVGRTRWNMPLLAISGGALLLLLNMGRVRANQRTARARHIPLVKIPKPAEGGPGPQAPGAPPRPTGAGQAAARPAPTAAPAARPAAAGQAPSRPAPTASPAAKPAGAGQAPTRPAPTAPPAAKPAGQAPSQPAPKAPPANAPSVADAIRRKIEGGGSGS